ncbi:MAG: bifunctional phosphoribosyl-AMP cyclohydrolase/phosphoribosyl-ATP diphosphatase HisIE [Saprospiraceae bacterium]|uniref:Histidine biosynthesis bifunctional protein HisIE n=1 Tax=Candidatus Opimibacter skivensis TaxID=2982028 RepID=A0A9D7SS58_9BACT|nr:bifunctional phosphoribosyl-AMP cyclohydrolase/phosphoribosyl-ATP diphosphatase HisIE [Candidatus Opimibacter skivensis]
MKPNFENSSGLVPVIIQDIVSLQVLMLGYMNEEAYDKTLAEKKVTFFSRSKNRLWTKGETSGHFLWVYGVNADCDNDTVLILAKADGPTCHTGAVSCFPFETSKGFLYRLEQTIRERIENNDENSYTNKLYKSGLNKVAQKVGEETVELIIEAKDNNPELFKNEAADLLYHLLILLKLKGFTLEDIEQVLRGREK